MTANIQHFKHMIALASIPGRKGAQDIVGFLQSAHSEAHLTYSITEATLPGKTRLIDFLNLEELINSLLIW
jgi:hypothetical protein